MLMPVDIFPSALREIEAVIHRSVYESATHFALLKCTEGRDGLRAYTELKAPGYRRLEVTRREMGDNEVIFYGYFTPDYAPWLDPFFGLNALGLCHSADTDTEPSAATIYDYGDVHLSLTEPFQINFGLTMLTAKVSWNPVQGLRTLPGPTSFLDRIWGNHRHF